MGDRVWQGIHSLAIGAVMCLSKARWSLGTTNLFLERSVVKMILWWLKDLLAFSVIKPTDPGRGGVSRELYSLAPWILSDWINFFFSHPYPRLEPQPLAQSSPAPKGIALELHPRVRYTSLLCKFRRCVSWCENVYMEILLKRSWDILAGKRERHAFANIVEKPI